MASRELWPTAKLADRVRSLAASGAPDSLQGYALLLTTGGMNPVHRGHVQLLHQAKKRLEREGFVVVGAWLSPSHDLYLQPKAQSLGTIGLSDKLRLEIARRATEVDELVAIGEWECAQKGYWPDFPEVAENLQQQLGTHESYEQLPGWSKEKPLTVFYACGTDHAEKCGLYRGGLHRPDSGVVVVPRVGDRPQGENPAKNVFVAEPCESAPGEGDVSSFSSTKVRQAIRDKNEEYLRQALSPEAVALLVNPTAKLRAEFADDFAKLGLS